jgi:hypothetical protein
VHAQREDDASYFRSQSELNRNVLDAFNEYGAQIMTPAYVSDPQSLKVVPREQWYESPSPPSGAPSGPADPGSADPAPPGLT